MAGALMATSSEKIATAPEALALKSFKPTPRIKKVGVVEPVVTISRLGVKSARSAMLKAPRASTSAAEKPVTESPAA